jgi:hypothetical protein
MEAGRVKEGMMVRSADGEKLGKVLRTSDDGFVVEKGLILPRDSFIRFVDAWDSRAEEIVVRYRREEIEDMSDAEPTPEQRLTADAEDRVWAEPAPDVGSADERIPLDAEDTEGAAAVVVAEEDLELHEAPGGSPEPRVDRGAPHVSAGENDPNRRR